MLILAVDLNFLLNAYLAENAIYTYGSLFVVLTVVVPNLVYLGVIRNRYKLIVFDVSVYRVALHPFP